MTKFDCECGCHIEFDETFIENCGDEFYCPACGKHYSGEGIGHA